MRFLKNKKRIIILFSAIFFVLLVLSFGMEHARAGNFFGGQEAEIEAEIGLPQNDPRIIIANIIRVALGFLGILAVVLIIYAGFIWMTAGGDEEKIDKAKKYLINATIGLVIIISSFAIATFVLSKLYEAAGGGGSTGCLPGECRCSGVCTSCPCPSYPPIGDRFSIRYTVPNNEAIEQPRNIELKAVLSRALGVDSETVRENFKIEKIADISSENGKETALVNPIEVAGRVSTSTDNRIIQYRPDADCGDEKGTSNCFAQWSKFRVTINGYSELVSVDGKSLDCSFGDCIFVFSTDNTIDTGPPTVEIYPAQMCKADDNILAMNPEANTVGARAKDDVGIADIEFLYKKITDIGNTFADSYSGKSGKNVYQEHQYDTSEMDVGSAYEFIVRAYDLAASSSVVSFTTNIKPGHCCNGIKDEDEEDVDCGGADCLSCFGGPCNISEPNMCTAGDKSNCSDSLCSTWYCGCATGKCICELKPIIDQISPVGGFCKNDPNFNTPCQKNTQASDCVAFGGKCDLETSNASIGSLITIGGRYFGTEIGKIEFSDDAGNTWKTAKLASQVNSDCDNSWQNDLIIAEVPAGLGIGKGIVLKVSAKNGNFDLNNDSRGPQINFVVSGIDRPSLCKINPNEGIIGNKINYYGLNFKNTDNAFFGDYSSGAYIKSGDFNFIDSKKLSASVPNMNTGKTSTFILNNKKINSNYLPFKKLSEPEKKPYISFFKPTSGNIGQYVTIHGKGFGSLKYTSKVYFGDKEASYSFPKVCADSVWADDQVIVKVPEGISNGSYIISIEIQGVGEAIDTGDLVPSLFQVSNSLALKPSLCKIDPSLGPIGSIVNLWGEYFGNKDANSKVRFNLNQNQSGTNISFWGKDPGNNLADKAITTVPLAAISGSVKIVKGSPELEGNGLNFKVGSCLESADPNSACGANFCCPQGSFKEGQCLSDRGDCYSQIKSSVYEWKFNTGNILPPPPYGSCQERSKDLGNCTDTCPNSPGLCSPYSGGSEKVLALCDNTCNIGACAFTSGTAPCAYNSALDRCVNNSNCSLNGTQEDVFGRELVSYCAIYNEVSRWHINTPLRCPDNWTKISNDRCVDLSRTCDLCGKGFKCLKNGEVGICAIDKDICPQNSICNSGNKCVADDSAICECCCEIGQDQRDCCAPLKCAGNCGEDKNPNDNAGFGYCSGCRITKADGSVDYVKSDQACNCAGHSGKVCDTEVDADSDGKPDGICVDCSRLKEDECVLRLGSCCFDKNKKSCTGGDGTANNGYCAVPVIKIGDECYNPLKYNKDQCTNELCSFSCIGDSPNYTNYQNLPNPYSSDPLPPPGENCGICCCDPDTDKNENDRCKTLINPILECTPNQEPCSGEKRGLCCGCSLDNQCGNIDLMGCGNDTCCHARPEVEEKFPEEGATAICRNVLISATFSEAMNKNTFSGNVVVVGNYGSSACPANTVYLTHEGDVFKKKSFFVKTYENILRKINNILNPILGKSAFAVNDNYCAIKGSVSGQELAGGNTKLNFLPENILEKEKEYSVIIKGDENLDSTKGVLSRWNIGMNGSMDQLFNGVEYKNAHIWTFTAGTEICKLGSVVIEGPGLFQPGSGSVSVSGVAHDFTAIGKAENGQEIVSINNIYSWKWNWSIDDKTVVNFAGGAPASGSLGGHLAIQTIEAQNKQDAKTYLKAIAEIVHDQYNFSGVGSKITGRKQVRVFNCHNPWPAVINGSWSPWQDSASNCPPGETCHNTNYEIYYCRDSGKAGIYDDLSALADGVVRGTDDNRKILKEMYFFRRDLPQSAGPLSALNQPTQGEAVSLQWINTDPNVVGYKIYYGLSEQNLSNELGWPHPNRTNISIGKGTNDGFDYVKLKNNIDYYFSVAPYYEGNVIGERSNIIKITPKDLTGPESPEIIGLIPGKDNIKLAWKDQSNGDALSFKLYYQAEANNCANIETFASSFAVSISNNPVVLPSLNRNVKYCFAMEAYDSEVVVSGKTLYGPIMPSCQETDTGDFEALATSTGFTFQDLGYKEKKILRVSSGTATSSKSLYLFPDTEITAFSFIGKYKDFIGGALEKKYAVFVIQSDCPYCINRQFDLSSDIKLNFDLGALKYAIDWSEKELAIKDHYLYGYGSGASFALLSNDVFYDKIKGVAVDSGLHPNQLEITAGRCAINIKNINDVSFAMPNDSKIILLCKTGNCADIDNFYNKIKSTEDVVKEEYGGTIPGADILDKFTK